LRIPKLRQGSFFPALLERRRRVDQALFAVVMEAYVHGVSTRKVDDLVKALGAGTGISKSEVPRICAGLDAEVAQFRDRTLAAQDFHYVFLAATYCKARVGHRIVAQGVPVAVGVAADGRREVLGFDVGDSENEGFWTRFLRSLSGDSYYAECTISFVAFGPLRSWDSGELRGLLEDGAPRGQWFDPFCIQASEFQSRAGVPVGRSNREV